MNALKKIGDAGKRVEDVLFTKTGRRYNDLTFDNFVDFLYRPTDCSSLGVTRLLFGLMMVLDGPEERGGGELDLRWGDPRTCHFPLLPLPVLSMSHMAVVYLVMWLGAIGVCVGYKFRRSALMFCIPYWYILLSDKSFWNNHSYLFGLVSFLLIGTQANRYMSLDAWIDKTISGKPVPYWNYFILKYQFFILYFVAGLKKSDKEWLSGYAMSSLSTHWVFDPFKLFISGELTDYLIVHWFGFIFDLTVCFWMMYEYTRPIAMVFCASFHLMNSRLFSIGMFPWVCLATMPLFCPPDWPKSSIISINETLLKMKLFVYSKIYNKSISETDQTENEIESRKSCIEREEKMNAKNDSKSKGISSNKDTSDSILKEETSDQQQQKKKDVDEDVNKEGGVKSENETSKKKVCWKKRTVVSLLLAHCGIQAFLPYSHFITKGYNNWTNGLYGYSWDMMVHTWDTILVLVKVVDNESKNEVFLDPEAWTINDRWSKHGDMMYQYAHCLRRNLLSDIDQKVTSTIYKTVTSKLHGDKKFVIVYDTPNPESKFDYDEDEVDNKENDLVSRDLSIYIDVWCSLNGRFQQRMFNPNVDLLNVKWSPFTKVEWLMPLLTEFSDRRESMAEIQQHVYSWNNFSDVLFVADFPGLFLENYITTDLSNVTITVLEGQVFFEMGSKRKNKRTSHLPQKSKAVHLTKGESYSIKSGIFHKIHTVGNGPACYMYTFMNATRRNMEEDSDRIQEDVKDWTKKPKLPLMSEWSAKFQNLVSFLKHVGNALLNIFYGVPMMRRIPIR